MMLALSKAQRRLVQIEGQNDLGEMSPMGTGRIHEVLNILSEDTQLLGRVWG